MTMLGFAGHLLEIGALVALSQLWLLLRVQAFLRIVNEAPATQERIRTRVTQPARHDAQPRLAA
jgi:hypothetical protein